MAEEFKRGQVVLLKSGSPPLTVCSVRGDGFVEVEWHDGQSFQSWTFRPEQLKPKGVLEWLK